MAVDGVVSLREAIQSINLGANVNADVTASGYGSFTDQIRFTGLSGTITLTSDLDAITKRVAISGSTGAGFAGKPVITIDGGADGTQINTTPSAPTPTFVLAGYTTFRITGPSVSILNLAVVRSRNAGIVVSGPAAAGAVIQGNYIGISATGAVLGNRTDGVVVDGGATGATIGGVLGQDTNVISGNIRGVGVGITGSGTSNIVVRGNLIGTDASGRVAVPNLNGVNIDDTASNTTIGGTDPSTRNIVSGNRQAGIVVGDTQGTLIQGNWIGTDATGSALGNGAVGVFITGSGTTVGGTATGTGNVIAFNGRQGVWVRVAPASGSNPSIPQGVQVLGNSIFSNGSLGFDLGVPGVTANDPLDGDTGPNQLQNYPVITSVIGNQIFGTVNSTPGVTLRLEFFSSTARDPSGFGEGETYLGSVNVTPDGNGNGTFAFTAPSSLVGLFATATATPTLGGTSEFSNAVLGLPTPPIIPPLTPPLVPPLVPPLTPVAVPVLNPPLLPPANTPILFPTTGGPTVTTGIPTVTAGQFAPTIGAQQALAAKAVLAASQGPGGSGAVRVYNPDGTLLVESAVFPGFSGGVRVGTADVNGDGVFDGIAAAGIGGAPHVKVFSGVDGSELLSFYAYDVSFTGGVFVTGGDLNGDGYAEIITGTGAGGGPNVKVFDGLTGVELTSFFAFDPSFRGGVTVAAADLNNDGLVDLVVGAGAGGTPHVKVIEGTSLRQVDSNGVIAESALLASYFAYSVDFTGGVFVSVGADLNGDGLPDVVTGAGAGGSPHVKLIDTAQMNSLESNGEIAGSALLGSFFGYEETFTGGVRVGEADSNQNGRNEIILGAGTGGGPRVRVFTASDLSLLEDFYAFDPEFRGGIFVD